MTTHRPDHQTVHAAPEVLGVLEVWVAEHPGMAVDVARSLGVLPPDERVGWLIGCDDQQAAGRLVWYLPAEPPEPARVAVQAADDIMDLLWEIAECHGIDAARDYATARGLRPPDDHPDRMVSVVRLDDGPPQWVWTDREDPRQINTTIQASGLAGEGPSSSAPSQAGQETASTTAENDGGPDMVVVDADLPQRIELWRAHLQGPKEMGDCAQRLGLTPPADGRPWQAVVGCVYALGRWDLYWTTVDEDTAQDWPVHASPDLVAELRRMLATYTGHQVAEAAIERGITPPDPTGWQIADVTHNGRPELRWFPYLGGEFVALDEFPETVQTALLEALADHHDLVLALRLQQQLTPRQEHELTSLLRQELANTPTSSDTRSTSLLERAMAVVDYLKAHHGEGT